MEWPRPVITLHTVQTRPRRSCARTSISVAVSERCGSTVTRAGTSSCSGTRASRAARSISPASTGFIRSRTLATSTSGRVTSHSETAASPSVAVRADRISSPSSARPPAMPAMTPGRSSVTNVSREPPRWFSTSRLTSPGPIEPNSGIGTVDGHPSYDSGSSPASPARTSWTLATKPCTSPRRHDDHADGPVARASAWVSAASRSRNAVVSTISATLAAVDGSSMSRRVAMFGSSRCQRTRCPIVRASDSVNPQRVAISTAMASPTSLWSPVRPLPMSCSRAPTASRSGRSTSRTTSAALTHVSMLCRSTVKRCTGDDEPRSRTSAHSGSQWSTTPA